MDRCPWYALSMASARVAPLTDCIASSPKPTSSGSCSSWACRHPRAGCPTRCPRRRLDPARAAAPSPPATRRARARHTRRAGHRGATRRARARRCPPRAEPARPAAPRPALVQPRTSARSCPPPRKGESTSDSTSSDLVVVRRQQHGSSSKRHARHGAKRRGVRVPELEAAPRCARVRVRAPVVTHRVVRTLLLPSYAGASRVLSARHGPAGAPRTDETRET